MVKQYGLWGIDVIRVFAECDLSAVMEIWLEGNFSAHPFISEKYWMVHYDMVKDALPQAEVYVYEDEISRRIQGFIGLQDEYIAGLFVRKAYRAKGIGRMLLEHAKGLKAILRLCVYCKNSGAVQFYLSQGFVQHGKSIDNETSEEELSMVWKK